jgi:DNA-binding CsgD family transcriptional regulator
MDGVPQEAVPAALACSPSTVRVYRHNIIKKTGCRSFEEVVLVCARWRPVRRS